MPKTIELSQSVQGHNGRVSRVTLRDPTYGDFMDLGFPVTYVSLQNGGGFQQEAPTVIREWVERLADIDPNMLLQLNIKDTLSLRDAVIDFFSEARGLASTPIPQNTSDKSASPQEPLSSGSELTRGPSKL